MPTSFAPASALANLHLTTGALAILALVVGVLVALSCHKMAQRSDPKIRLFLMLSVLNISLLVLIYAVPRVAGEKWALSSALSLPPTLIYEIPAIALLSVSFLRPYRDMLPLNVVSAALGLWAVMGLRFAVVAPPDDVKTAHVMSWNVGSEKTDIHKVIENIRRMHPDVICLQDLSSEGRSAEIPGHLTNYHWVRQGGLAIGSQSNIEILNTAAISAGSKTDTALVASTDAFGHEMTVAAVRMTSDGSVESQQHLAQEADKLKQALHGKKGSVVMAASIDSQPSSPVYGAILKDYLDPFDHLGSGFGYTEPAVFPIRRVDYIFAGRETIVKAASVEHIEGASHLPVMATIGLPKLRRQ